ncbi:MAG: hypothetical protein EOO41_04325 [Methanobacteriota archaeon]|nr:MAG: hypothetical protein EOO41_04325 [Euryarchaeota archaeon]
MKALAQVQQNICAQDTSSTLLPTLQLLTSPGAPDKLSVHNALLARLVHPDDLAFYICLNAVLHMSRAEIRSKVCLVVVAWQPV